MKTVEQVREFGKQGLNKSEIARIVGINRVTVAKYLKDDFNPSSAYYNTTIPSKIKPYSQEIKNMLSEGKTFKQISAVIRERGYDGADGTIRMFATRERRLMKEAAEQGGSGEKIERKWLISLLYHPVDEVRSLSQDQLDRIIEEYPIIGRVYDAVTGFKGALFGKKEAELDKWAKETEALEIDELESFINGIKRDITAVKNAIRLDYNNGLAEGSVNKLKVVKRIMYGRNSFELLKGKLLRLELKRKIN
jgi:DNA-binding CsgD family transcriptional regulator